MLERLAGHEYFCFLDGFSGYFQIPIAPEDQEKTTFTCPYGTFTYKRMPFGLCNASATFQCCMIAIFHELIEDNMEVFMDDFSIFGSSFDHCLKNLEKMLKMCEETNLVLNWEKCHFMVKEGIILGHKVSGSGIEILVKDAPFNFSEECIKAFDTLKREMTQAPIMIKLDWSLPFEIMCDASDYAVGAILGQRIDKHFKPIHYASKIMNEAQENYTTTEKELLAIRDKKGAENLVADHLSRLENPDLGMLTRAEIRDLFTEERLMEISNKNNKLWYADYANYLASRLLPFRSTRQEKKKFFSDLRHYIWDEPFLFKQCVDRIIRRCVAGDEAAQILRQCHNGPSGGHHGIATTARKVFEAGFYWTHIFRDARKLVQRLKPSTSIDVKNVVNFLKRLFAQFGIPKALISDRGTHFCNHQMEKAMKRKDWSYKLDDALWHSTAFKTPLGTTPFRIIYGKHAIFLSNQNIKHIGP
ncbi:reverse transcriptase domain-containing protein [Tanacetum coccineum]